MGICISCDAKTPGDRGVCQRCLDELKEFMQGLRETPEQFNARKGHKWGDESGVYMRIGKNEWRLKTYREAKKDAKCCKMDKVPYKIYCANTDAGIPEEFEE